MDILNYTRNSFSSSKDKLANLDIFSKDEKKQIRSDWQAFKNVLTDHKINLYHFTDKSNLDSIKSHGGLFSWDYCKRNNIHILEPGGNELSRDLDLKKGLKDYVRVCFNCEPRMLYAAQKKEGRIKNPVFLKIDPRIVYLNSTLFSDMNATDRLAHIGGCIEHLQQIKFDVVNCPIEINGRCPYF